MYERMTITSTEQSYELPKEGSGTLGHSASVTAVVGAVAHRVFLVAEFAPQRSGARA